MQLSSIYASIQEDLDKVEESLQLMTKTDLISMPDLLSHALEDKGKRIRPALTLLSGKFYDHNMKLLLPMATAVELLHIATLVHDDTIDGSKMRWRRPTINSLWGKEIALIVGDYLFAASADLVSTTGNIEVMQLFARTLMNISAGELRQNFSAYKANITREEYYQQINCKTASLFSMACETGAILSNAPLSIQSALKNYGTHVGMGFQIVDDILDFTGTEEELGKPVGSDLMQGTVTLPAILYMQKYPDNSYIQEALQNKGNSDSVKRAVEAISNSPAIQEAYQLAIYNCNQANDNLKEIPDGSTRAALEALSDFVTRRNK